MAKGILRSEPKTSKPATLAPIGGKIYARSESVLYWYCVGG